MRNIKRVVATGATTLALTAASLMTASTAFADSSTDSTASAPALRVVQSIKVIDGNEWSTDEVVITINGNKVWSASMDDEDEKYPDLLVHTGDTLKVWEEDIPYGPNDLIGTATIRNGATLNFQNSGAHYTVLYN